MLLLAQIPPVPDAEALATKGTPYVLAVCVIALSAALVYVFRLYRSDLKEKRAEFLTELDAQAKAHAESEGRWRAEMKEVSGQFMAALKEQRGEFHQALKEVVADLRGGMNDLKAGLQTVAARLDRLEDAVSDGPAVAARK